MEARRRGIPYHYDVLRVLKAGFDELSHGVVRANRYEMFRAVVEDAIDELGDRLPQFQERYFFVRTPEGDFYDVEALRGYLGMALAVLRRGLSQEFSAFDIAMMKLAIEEARKCVSEDTRVHPRVGVVVTKGQTLGRATPYSGSYVLVLFPEAREVFIDDHNQGNNLAASGRPRALVVGAGVHTFRLGGAPDVEPATQILDVPDRPILNPFSVVFQKV